MVAAMEIQTGFKQTEVGVIPSDWNVKSIGDIAKISVGRDLKKANFSSDQDSEYKYPVYSNTVSKQGLYGYYNVYEYSGESLTVIGRGVGLGTAFKKSGDYGAIGRLLVLEPNKNIDAKYLTEFINYKLNIFFENSGVPQLTGISFATYKVSLPPTKAEQTAIATALNDADALITQLEKLIAKKRAIKQGAMQELLNGMRRLPNFSDDWITIALGDVGIFKTSSVDKVIVPGEKEVYLLNYMDVYKNSVINKTIITSKTSANNNELQNFNLKRGDIVFTPSSETPDDIGHSAVINEDLPNTLFSYHIVRYRFYDNEFMSHDFKRYVLNNKTVLDYFSQRATGSTRFVLTRKDFNETVVRIPTSYEEQSSIAKILADMDTEIEKLEKKLGKYKMVKQGMMQNLLTGRIRLV